MSSDVAALPRLHIVTDDEVLARPGWTLLARSILNAGGSRAALHVRGPGTDGSVLFRLVSDLVGTAGETGAVLVVNDRVDVALTTGAPAVQLGVRSLPVEAARRVLGPSALVGRSVHTPEETSAARAEGADFVVAGSIYETVSHPGQEGLGPGAIETFVAAAQGLPLLGIGGVTPERVPEVVGAGAHGVAAIRGVWDRADPERAVMDYIAALAKAS